MIKDKQWLTFIVAGKPLSWLVNLYRGRLTFYSGWLTYIMTG